mgnify:CR=1 FL=1
MNLGDRISTIKGIGAKTESHLARIGIYTVGIWQSITQENIMPMTHRFL